MPDKRIVSGAAAGAVAATVWALQEPIDQKLFGFRYSDPELLAKPFRAPKSVGFAMHVANGAVFGAVYSVVAAQVPAPGPVKGAAAGMAEHLATWPLTRFVPRVNLWGNRRAFWQAVWRHLLFGVLLGTLEERLSESYAEPRLPA